jgi:hypothetical protein
MVSHSDLKLWSMTICTHDSPIVMAHHNSQQPNSELFLKRVYFSHTNVT